MCTLHSYYKMCLQSLEVLAAGLLMVSVHCRSEAHEPLNPAGLPSSSARDAVRVRP